MADVRATGSETVGTADQDVSDTALLPRTVRRWVVGALVMLMAFATYLIAVRGSTILFDLRDAVSALCM